MARAGLWFAVAMTVGGCNAILGLDRTSRADRDAASDAPGPGIDARATSDASIDARGGCAVLGHDEDADGVDDGCDICPDLADTEQKDGDGDRVGDACDPSPTGNDDIIAFDSFAVPASWQPQRGLWDRQNDAFRQLDMGDAGTLALRAVGVSSYTADLTVEITGVLPLQTGEVTAERAIGVWFAARNGSAQTDPSGYLCTLSTDLGPGTGFVRASLYAHDQGGDKQLASGMVLVGFAEGTLARFRVVAIDGAPHCQISVDSATVDLPGDSTAFSGGDLGMRTQNVSANLRAATIYAKNP